MSFHYERLSDPGAGLRLHRNENTAGCSPRVLEAMRAVTRGQAGFYPDYARVYDTCARALGVDSTPLLLTNGLDEGIHLVANLWLQRGGGHFDDGIDQLRPGCRQDAASAWRARHHPDGAVHGLSGQPDVPADAADSRRCDAAAQSR